MQNGERCDDGNTVNDDSCTNECTLPTCGDAIIQSGEQCDDGNADNTDGCTSTCKRPMCGDGFVQPSNHEQCDDGNGDDADSCTNSCQTPICGDGIIQPDLGELCDDGNTIPNDGCSNSCYTPFCGDGIVQAGEECDEGFGSTTCTWTCKIARCGDGVLQTSRGEECDDGNLTSNDACSATCRNESRFVFVTSKLYNGNLGGLAGADAKCQALAQAAGLPGTYRAWLSSSTASPSTRFTQFGGRYVTVTGTVIAYNWGDLTDGGHLAPINVTELGGSIPLSATNQCAPAAVWSMTSPFGTSYVTNTSFACGDWTNTTGGAQWALGTDAGAYWSGFCSAGAGSCAWTASLYCFQQ
jgi:cysteine-rich repeat protein